MKILLHKKLDDKNPALTLNGVANYRYLYDENQLFVTLAGHGIITGVHINMCHYLFASLAEFPGIPITPIKRQPA